MTKGQDWKAMLAEAVAKAQAVTKVPVSKGLRDAFVQQGHAIPMLDNSGRFTPQEMREMLEETLTVIKKDL